MGTASLLVYWVHIELVYGRWLAWWKNALDVPQTIMAAAGMILLMLLLAAAKANRDRIAAWISDAAWGPTPDRVSGD